MSLRVTFAVKGSEQTGHEQLKARGIVAQTAGFTSTGTIFRADPRYFSSIVAWFNEPTQLQPDYGFPDGTLMYYSMPEEGK